MIGQKPRALPQPLEESIRQGSGLRTVAWETVAVVDHPMITIKTSWPGGHLRAERKTTPKDIPKTSTETSIDIRLVTPQYLAYLAEEEFWTEE